MIFFRLSIPVFYESIIASKPKRISIYVEGQWAHPGGQIEEGQIEEDTALREHREEVGLDLNLDSILGRLDDFATRSGLIMTP